MTAPAFATNPTAAPSLADRILDCFPGGSYALGALLRLLDIVESDEVPTGAVECRAQPRLLVNAGFVAQYANTPEKLLMLVMHELHHVLLGHTTFFGTSTPVKNFVFDAVINGLICRMFPQERYTAFLTGYYDSASFPQCLLRPPPKWPQGYATPAALRAFPPERRKAIEGLHRALYSDGGATYKEVFDILPTQLGDCGVGDVPLLGDHSEQSATNGGVELRSPLLFDVVRGIVEQWPQPPDPIQGRSLADILRSETITRVRQPSARAVLRGLIRRIATSGAHGRRRMVGAFRFDAQQPIPNFDRRTSVLRALGHSPLLHAGSVTTRRVIRAGERVHIYVDVSGSMDAVKGPLYGAVHDCRSDVHPRIHLFSTAISDISPAELGRGVCHSTGGTNIACVAEHMARERITRALIVTDGFVGAPRGAHLATLTHATLAVAYLGANTSTSNLEKVTDFAASIRLGALK
jgi:hypothetical protein